MTKDNRKHFIKTTRCEVCDKKNSESVDKHKHHDWNVHPEFNIDNTLKTGNYIGALCFQCNILIANKQKLLTVVTHNFSKYNSKYIIAGINDDIHHPLEILTKSSECVTSLKDRY